MRYVDKSNCCAEFDAWLKKKKTLPVWKDWRGKVKQTLYAHLLDEQKGLCIYCQQAIPEKVNSRQNSDPVRSHIEHIRPRHFYFNLTFDYSNLSVSCEGFDCAATEQSEKEFCGHWKDDEYDENQFLHPFELQDIEDYFEYDADGRIFANSLKNEVERKKAEYMIATLALNHTILIQKRAETYGAIIEKSDNDINELLDSNVANLPSFYSMLKFLFLT